jgi:hypothetical protein
MVPRLPPLLAALVLATAGCCWHRHCGCHCTAPPAVIAAPPPPPAGPPPVPPAPSPAPPPAGGPAFPSGRGGPPV